MGEWEEDYYYYLDAFVDSDDFREWQHGFWPPSSCRQPLRKECECCCTIIQWSNNKRAWFTVDNQGGCTDERHKCPPLTITKNGKVLVTG